FSYISSNVCVKCSNPQIGLSSQIYVPVDFSTDFHSFHTFRPMFASSVQIHKLVFHHKFMFLWISPQISIVFIHFVQCLRQVFKSTNWSFITNLHFCEF